MSDALSAATPVAVTGSPSSNSELTLDVSASASHAPLVGQMVVVQQQISTSTGSESELAFGTVSEVSTTNQWHASPSLLGIVKQSGELAGMTGDAGDIRSAKVRLQSAFRRADEGCSWRPAGAGLSTSPATGTSAILVDDAVIQDVVVSGHDERVQYLGHLLGPATRGGRVRVPFSIPDFTGSRGGYQFAVFGQTGSGKTAMSSYLLAGLMSSESQGMILVDPQGQFTSEKGLPFSLQGFAAELGRTVMVRRISEDLQLEKSAPLFCTLLGKTKFTRSLMKMSGETAELLLDEVERALRRIDDWEVKPASTVLVELVEALCDPKILNRIYSEETRRERLLEALRDIVDDAGRRAEVLTYFEVIHNLFSDRNPAGEKRHSLWSTLSSVFDSHARSGAAAPVLILDMSTADISWLDQFSDSQRAEAMEAILLLDSDTIKAAILRQVFATLKRTAEAAFRGGEGLNTLTVIDEAWRYVPPPAMAADDEIAALSTDMAGYARDFRKFGLGVGYISQAARSLHPDIFDQLLIKVIGYGLAGHDLDKVAEHLDDRDPLKLYRAFVPPDSTPKDARIYPFMWQGPVSPLAVTRAPIMTAAYTDFDDFRADNAHWIAAIRNQMGAPLLTGLPAPLTRSATAAASLAGKSRAAKKKAAKQVNSVLEHKDTGGIPPTATQGLPTAPEGYGNPLAALEEDDPAPF